MLDQKDRKEMGRMRFEEHMALADIAEHFGVTPQRVQQITGKADHAHCHTKAQMERSRTLHQERRSFAAAHPEMTTKQLAKALGLDYSYAGQYWEGTRHAVEGTEEQTKGFYMEEYVSMALTAHGIPHRLTNSHGGDIVLRDGRTVEIRSRWQPEPNRSSENFYFFPQGRERAAGKPLADIYIFAIVRERMRPDLFIIPAGMLPKTLAFGFCWPKGRERGGAMDWTRFYERFDLLRPRKKTLWQGKKALLRQGGGSISNAPQVERHIGTCDN